MLAQSIYTPSLPGILELSGIALCPEKLAETIVNECRHALGWDFNALKWSPEEQARIQHFVEHRFANKDWNNKR